MEDEITKRRDALQMAISSVLSATTGQELMLVQAIDRLIEARILEREQLGKTDHRESK